MATNIPSKLICTDNRLLLLTQVARIQLSLVESLKLRPPSTDLQAAIDMLNGELMDITKLYGDFAEPYQLAECKLAIVHCAGHFDPTLIESLWREIITNGGCESMSVQKYFWITVCKDT